LCFQLSLPFGSTKVPMQQQLLIIGYVWPEPKTTAAGTRMLQLIQLFQENGWQITFASTASKTSFSENLNSLGVTEIEIELNDSGFDAMVKNLQPNAVLFDRFFTEEQFGWRIAENCPDALRILDTEDLHFLRQYREAVLKNTTSSLYSDVTKREIAAIYRCDLSLIISEKEMELLLETFHLPAGILHYLPFLEAPLLKNEIENLPSFSEREHLIFFGNFKHKPNVDTAVYLKKDIWPLLKNTLPDTELHIYGAYATQQLLEFNNPKDGFFVHDWVEDLDKVLQHSRLLVAPLRFGAGLKGKIIQAIRNGTVIVTTAIGAEGIFSLDYNVGNDLHAFAALVNDLYSDEQQWLKRQRDAFEVLNKQFDSNKYSAQFFLKLATLFNDISSHRQSNFVGLMLQYHLHQSSKYLSKWIEEKHKKQM